MSLGAQWIGQEIGNYRVLSVLGEGGMGLVLRAEHRKSGQIVAIKLLRPELLSDFKYRQRFLREAQAMARLNHPNAIRLYDCVDSSSSCYLVMECLEGQTIREHMGLRGIIPAQDCCLWAEQILSALRYAHDQQVVHRDLKPSNIMVTAFEQVKLLDFGTAKVLDATKLTAHGMTLGTVVYMPPEQLRGQEIDARSDIYALGITLYEMCTSQLPYAEATDIVCAQPKPPIPPTVHYPFLPRRLESIILKAIALDPRDRFQSAGEMLKYITALKKELTVSGLRTLGSDAPSRALPAMPAEPAEPALALPPTLPPRTPMWLGAAALLLLAAGLSVGCQWAGYSEAALLSAVLLGQGALFLALLALRPAAALEIPADEPAAPPDQPVPGVPPSVDPALRKVREDSARFKATVAADYSEVLEAMPGIDLTSPEPQPLGPHLYVLEGPSQGQQFFLQPGEVMLGRGESCGICLPDPGISEVHARITLSPHECLLEDLDSSNGCYVNSTRVRRQPLRDQDMLIMGSTLLVVGLKPAAP